MKSACLLAILLIASVASAQDGTKSVLVNAPEAASAPTAAAEPAPTACCETAKLAKLPSWQLRRLNRIADRQEAREARKCCCDPCDCEKDEACKCKARPVVVEARR